MINTENSDFYNRNKKMTIIIKRVSDVYFKWVSNILIIISGMGMLYITPFVIYGREESSQFFPYVFYATAVSLILKILSLERNNRSIS